ncbi:MAG: PQQ-binding-like beta-propeller repeat protein, partial [Planctomycetota bacterium]
MAFCSRSLALTLCLSSIAFIDAQAEDWPGWMGSQRDGVYREDGIIDSIPEDGLKFRWKVPIQGGYAGPAVSDGKVFVFDYVKSSGSAFNNPGQRATLQGKERLTALEVATGKVLWQLEYDCPYSISYPAGPRCTPTVDGDRVYTLGSQGDLKCVSVSDGNEIWSRSFVDEFQAEVPIWGFSAHPLVHGDRLYTMVGGINGSVVAFDKMTGKTVWEAIKGKAGYCPPVMLNRGGTEHLLVYHPDAVALLNPDTGQSIWSVDIQPEYEMSISRPMIDGNRMYASGIHDSAVMIDLSDDGLNAKPAWRSQNRNDAIHSSNATPMFVDGILYGTDGDTGALIAMNSEGEILWQTFEPVDPGQRRFVKHGTAFLTRLGDSNRYIIF